MAIRIKLSNFETQFSLLICIGIAQGDECILLHAETAFSIYHLQSYLSLQNIFKINTKINSFSFLYQMFYIPRPFRIHDSD